MDTSRGRSRGAARGAAHRATGPGGAHSRTPRADHVVQPQRRTVPSGASGPAPVVGEAEDLDIQPARGESLAELRDADPDAGGAARRVRGEQADLHSVRRASAHRRAWSNHDGFGGGRRSAAWTACISPSAKRSGPQLGDDPLAGPAHRGAPLVGHRGDALHQPGQRLDVVGIEGEAVDAVLDEIGGAAAAVGDEHRQARRPSPR